MSEKRHGGTGVLKLIWISEDTYRKSYISCVAFPKNPVPQNSEDESICAVSLASRGVGFTELSFLKVRNDGISRRFGGNISASRGNISGNAYFKKSDFLFVKFFHVKHQLIQLNGLNDSFQYKALHRYRLYRKQNSSLY